MDFVSQFRSSAPYIHAYRGKTCVVWLRGKTLAHERLKSTISDLALLNSLGLKLIILFESDAVASHHVIDEAHLSNLTQRVGQHRYTIEALFSQGIVNSPMHNAKVRVVSGNYVMARPAGVFDGQDLKFQGRVRRVDHAGIREQLEKQHIVLIPPLGYSVTGDILYMPPEALVVDIARQVNADKVIIIGENPLPLTNNQKEMGVATLQTTLTSHKPDDLGYLELSVAAKVAAAGVARCHVIDGTADGALLSELFTRDGIGTLIALDQYDSFRSGRIDDVQGILNLLQPLVEKNILVKRDPETIEAEISQFVINERDGMVIGCAAVHPLSETQAELACVAVHPEYQKNGRGDALLNAIEKQAKNQNIQELIVLTTQTEHWFVERGFRPMAVAELPDNRQVLYNKQRNSKIYVKSL